MLEESFTRVLKAARAGSGWAWRELYDETAPTVARYVKARGANDPDDVVGDVFLAVVRHIGTFTGNERDFRAWLLAIARNRLIDEARTRGRRQTDPAPDDVLANQGPAGDVEEEALVSLEADRVRRLLGELTPEQRDVLLLRILGGLTIEEVARVMGKRSGAVKMLQARGITSLQRKIAERTVTL